MKIVKDLHNFRVQRYTKDGLCFFHITWKVKRLLSKKGSQQLTVEASLYLVDMFTGFTHAFCSRESSKYCLIGHAKSSVFHLH